MDTLSAVDIFSHFDLIFRAMPDAVVLTDKDRCIMQVNPAFSNLFGYRFDDVKGKHSELLYPDKEAFENQDNISPSLKPENQPEPHEITYQKKDGGLLVCETAASEIKDTQGNFIGYLKIIRDISHRKNLEKELQETRRFLEHTVSAKTFDLRNTANKLLISSIERKKTEQKLFKSQQQCEQTFNAMSDIITIQDKDMRIVKANRAAHDILNIYDDSLIGQFCYTVFSGRTEPCPGCPELSTLQDVCKHSNIITHTKLDKTFQVSSSPVLDENNEVEYLVHVAKDITEQKKLEEDKSIFNDLVNQSNDAFYVLDIAAGTFLFANKKGFDNLGYDSDELIGMSVATISQKINSLQEWHNHIKYIREYGFRLFETIHQRKDGTYLPVEVNAKIINYDDQEFLVSVVRNISDRKQAEENLLKEKNKLEAVLAAMGDGLTLQDTNFKIIYQNEVHKQKQGDHIGEYCYNAYHGRDAVCENCLLEKCFSDGEVHRGEAKVKTAKGTMYLEVSASPIRDGSGQIIGGIETARDITEPKMLAMQVQQHAKMEAMGTLAGGIAHDFNNILSAIVGYSELVKLGIAPGSKAAQDIDQVIKAGRRAESLVKQILTFSRNDEHEVQVISPHLIVKEALKLLRSSIPTTIKIEQNIDSECGPVEADPTRIHQVVMNLCTNAMQAMENQKGTLSINLCRKEITEIPFHTYDVAPGSYIVLSVHDTGHGIDKRMMERIFDPYFTSKEAGKGTGLGLSVIDGIVKGYKGFITVESEPGNGASFHVHLPALKQDTSPQEIQEQEEKLENGKEHILVIDDEAIIANINKAILERLGYTATAMSDSAKALETIRSNPDQFDLLFTDQTMPNLTGAELSLEVLKINPQMPIILCTGYSSVFSQKEALEMGIRKYVTKPISRKELAEVVRNVLDENSFSATREKYPETAQVN